MQSIHYAAATGKVNIIKYLIDNCNVPATVAALVSCVTAVYVRMCSYTIISYMYVRTYVHSTLVCMFKHA